MKGLDELSSPLVVVRHLIAQQPHLVTRRRMQQASEVVVGLYLAAETVPKWLLTSQYWTPYWVPVSDALGDDSSSMLSRTASKWGKEKSYPEGKHPMEPRTATGMGCYNASLPGPLSLRRKPALRPLHGP